MNKIGVIGLGRMGGTIASSLILQAKKLKIELIAYDKAKNIRKKFHSICLDSLEDLVKNSDWVILAIKPQIAKEVFRKRKELFKNKKVISVMAGISIKWLKDNLSPSLVVRTMPNLPALIGEGVTALFFEENVDKNDREFVEFIFQQLGKSIIVEEENLMHSVTALSGSGPAFVYQLMEYFINAGLKMDLSGEQAKILTYETFKGSIELLFSGEESLEERIKAVKSPGGTTEAGINFMKSNKVQDLIKDVFVSAKEKSEDLSI
jgi:pyrroline-5-carboxylate reductase